MHRRLRIGIDIGGTFTDFVALDVATGQVQVDKCLTTPDRPQIGVMSGLKQFLAKMGTNSGAVRGVIHGTTLVANTLIERKGVRTGLITTQGFRDILEIGNEIRYDIYNLQMDRPVPLVGRPLRMEVEERISAEGEVLTPVNEGSLAASAATLAAEGVESIAVTFLHSFRNPDHEETALQWLQDRYPDIDISISSRVSPEIREWQRTCTTVANAYVRPIIRKYIGELERNLRDLGIEGSFHIMSSAGGMTGTGAAKETPIRIIESGPAAGVLVGAMFGRLAGERDVIAFDMGGTTAKIGLVTGGEPTRSNTFEAARVQRFKKGSGIPLNVPVLEMIEIGAGGGSMASFDALGLLQVGPQSAGSVPGPVCYGLGGHTPTVTDADLLLGLFDPDYFLGGEMKLDVEGARAAMEAKVAARLGVSAVEAAASIYRTVGNNMTSAASVHIAERGFDPRQFALVATGGAGPVHAFSLGTALGVSKILYPLTAGTASALGFLTAPLESEMGRSYMDRLDRLDWGRVNALLADLREDCLRILLEAGAAPDQIVERRSADMRYVKQGYEIEVTLPQGDVHAGRLSDIRTAFDAEYKRLYGRSLEVPVEALNWRVRLTAPVGEVRLQFTAAEGNRLKGSRKVYLPDTQTYADVTVYNRYALRPGDQIDGPAIFEERESTVFVGPGAHVLVDDHLTLHVIPPSRLGQIHE